MNRDLKIVALTTVAVLVGFLIYTSYDTITSAGAETRESIKEINAATERVNESIRQREAAEQKRRDATDAHL